MTGQAAHSRRRGPAPQRPWTGPLFGRQPEKSDAYLTRIMGLTTDPGAHFYLDTNFLMLLAKLGPDARRQFTNWCATISPARMHVPLWSAHEFFKHRLLNTIYNELATDISLFDAAAKRLYSSLQIYASDELFGFSDSGALMVGEYKRTVQPLRAMLKLAAKSTATSVGIQEVAAFIDQHLLSGPLDELIEDLETDERIRNRGTIPPGFKDATKRGGTKGTDEREDGVKADNSFGDIVFWREILRHAKRSRAGAILILTKDRKNDWYENHHGDAGLTTDFRRRIARPLPVPAPHPLLVREAHDLGVGTLDLIDPMYCGVLLEAAGEDYKQFASAVLNAELPEPESNPKRARGWSKRFGPDVRVLGAERPAGGEEEPSEDGPFDPTVLTSDLLAAGGEASQEAAATLLAITDGDLVAKVEAFEALTAMTLQTWPVADLVTLGRVAARLADEAVAPATDFIANLRDLGPEMPASVRSPIYFGALGSVFLTDDAQARPLTGARAATTLLDMATSPEMQEARSRLAGALSELGVRHSLGSIDPIELEVVTEASADNKSAADLLALKVGGIDLMTELQEDPTLRFSSLLGHEGGVFDVQVGALVEIVSRYHRLPRQLLKPSVNTDALVKVPEFAGVETDV